MAHDVKAQAAEYAAGELDPEDCQRFEAAMRADDALAAEVRFWQGLRGGLAAAPRPRPGKLTEARPDLAQSLLRRAALERRHTPARPLRLPRWVVAGALAAACLALGFGFGIGATVARHEPPAPLPIGVSEISATEPAAYAEDGSAITPPPSAVAWTTWMPLSTVEHADATKPLPMTPAEKPWIGVWTRQARLVLAGSKPREAHLVVRVVGGSPAWKAGLRPGDMITGIDHCAVDDPRCLGMHLAKTAPGASLFLEYWSAEDAAFRSGTAVLETVHE